MSSPIDPQHDYLHPITDHPDHNESAYYNFGVVGGITGWVRIGNRINDGFAEVTVCLYTPDQRIAFWWKRAEIADPGVHNAGGLRFEVLEPFRSHRVTYAGPVALFDDFHVLENPKEAFAQSPRADCEIDLQFTAASPVWGGPEGSHNSKAFDGFAGNHFEQHMTVTGTVRIGDEEFPLVDGLSVRDHSWGPRKWQQVHWYRWLTASLTPNLGFACTIIGELDGNYATQGYLHRGPDKPLLEIVDATVQTNYDEDWYPTEAFWVLTTEDGVKHRLDAEVRLPLPLRHVRDGETTRIIEGATVYSLDDTRGPGLTEYLDLVVDGNFCGARFA
ncbi:DUF7064 domain-containing protein [Nocardia sp. NPDC004123]